MLHDHKFIPRHHDLPKNPKIPLHNHVESWKREIVELNPAREGIVEAQSAVIEVLRGLEAQGLVEIVRDGDENGEKTSFA